jgi:lipopolysaccharide transport system ATP-binding protein
MLFVSHDANTVKHLCDKALMIRDGRVVSYGIPRDVIDLYQGLVAQKTDMSEREVVVTQNASSPVSWQKATTMTSNDEADLIDFKLLDLGGQQVTHLESETPLTVQYVVKLRKNFDRPAFGLIVRDRIGRSIFETSTYAMGMADTPLAGGSQVVVRFLFDCNLRAGQYSFSVGVANRGYARSEFEEYSLLMHDVEQLQVVESSTAIFYGGIFNMHPAVSLDVLALNHG